MSPRVGPVYKLELRTRIIEAAIDCFSELGFSGARMEDIAKRLDLGKGTIYLYFESKEDLFVAICEYYLDALKNHFSQLLDSNLDILSDAETIYDNSRKLECGNKGLMFLEIMLESAHNERLKKALREHRLKVNQTVIEFLERQYHLFARKKNVNVADLAVGFVALHDGLNLSRLQGISEESNRAAWVAMLRAALGS